MIGVIPRGFYKGYPLYEYADRDNPERLDIAGPVSVGPPDNEPGSVADRAARASDVELVEMVLSGEKPAVALDYCDVGNQDLEEALKLAKDSGLSALFVRHHGEFACAKPVSVLLIGRDAKATRRVLAAFDWPQGSPEFHIAFGRALGYSEEDIRRFCRRSGCAGEIEINAAFTRVGPRL